jgi:hypothetical protein
MQKSSLKLFFGTFLLTLLLASFAFAGNDQCPIAPPPPDEDGRGPVPVIVSTNPSDVSSYQFLKGFWELLSQSTDLF